MFFAPGFYWAPLQQQLTSSTGFFRSAVTLEVRGGFNSNEPSACEHFPDGFARSVPPRSSQLEAGRSRGGPAEPLGAGKEKNNPPPQRARLVLALEAGDHVQGHLCVLKAPASRTVPARRAGERGCWRSFFTDFFFFPGRQFVPTQLGLQRELPPFW